jgi:hypothetical protein
MSNGSQTADLRKYVDDKFKVMDQKIDRIQQTLERNAAAGPASAPSAGAVEGGPKMEDLLAMMGFPHGIGGMPGSAGMTSPWQAGMTPPWQASPPWQAMQPAGLWTIWWAWWMSWFLWPMALPLACSGMFPLTSRFAATRAEFWHHCFEAFARIAQQVANASPFGTGAGYNYPGPNFPQFKPVDAELAKQFEAALKVEPLNSLSPERQAALRWAVRSSQIMASARQR